MRLDYKSLSTGLMSEHDALLIIASMEDDHINRFREARAIARAVLKEQRRHDSNGHAKRVTHEQLDSSVHHIR